MNFGKKLFSLIRLAGWKTIAHPGDALLSLRMALWVGLITVAAELTSLPRTQKLVSFRIRQTSGADSLEARARLARIIDNLLGIDLYPFRRSCWKRALVLHRYLALIGVESQIRFGVRKEMNGKVDGHAWLEHEGQPLLEENAANYVVTFTLPTESSACGQSASYQL